MKSGAGGNWHRFDEKFDGSIVKQTSGLSCVSAVGEMWLKNRGIYVPQKQIIDIIGEPATLQNLARTLNQFDEKTRGQEWHGTVIDEDGFEILIKRENWGVILREPLTLGHAVLIDGITNNGLIKVKDPYDQTAYKMTKSDFFNNWGGEVIFYGKTK